MQEEKLIWLFSCNNKVIFGNEQILFLRKCLFFYDLKNKNAFMYKNDYLDP
ncbi:hypothetical protein DFP97_10563 [Paenibacillus prosopidis]|uniref:Uncharacterized protein n=1 Tax=Paenibacillus prosopidis TaxID=630520 RepID=A0A368W8B4_9BACL|nr:hypothetical protein DFP97_10563 [Paenibacillus prosopidis]